MDSDSNPDSGFEVVGFGFKKKGVDSDSRCLDSHITAWNYCVCSIIIEMSLRYLSVWMFLQRISRRRLRPPRGVCEAHLHQAYKLCVIAAIQSPYLPISFLKQVASGDRAIGIFNTVKGCDGNDFWGPPSSMALIDVRNA